MRKATDRRFRGGLIALAFLGSVGASIGLIVLYAAGGDPQAEGALLLAALGGIGVGLILWAHRFLPHGPYVQPREPLASTETERQAFAQSFERGAEPIERRAFLARMLAAALGALGVAALFPIRSLGPSPGQSLFRTRWRRGTRLVTADGLPVTVDGLETGGVLTVFPEGAVEAADSQTVLIRVDPLDFSPLPGRDDWSPDGYLAYSKICTHAGCPVGLYEAQTRQLFCPCHQSVFDAVDGARPVSGPASRPLPQLPLEVDANGYLRSQSDYTEPVGPAFWNLGQP
jgi:ubiquinol-cytochrome c reductase iron-sulfur subunit